MLAVSGYLELCDFINGDRRDLNEKQQVWGQISATTCFLVLCLSNKKAHRSYLCPPKSLIYLFVSEKCIKLL